MEDIDIEQQEPFPVERDGQRLQRRADQPDGEDKVGCCGKFQESVSRWMLPEDARSKYLERANCCPPPIFIILVSIVEVLSLRPLWVLPLHAFLHCVWRCDVTKGSKWPDVGFATALWLLFSSLNMSLIKQGITFRILKASAVEGGCNRNKQCSFVYT